MLRLLLAVLLGVNVLYWLVGAGGWATISGLAASDTAPGSAEIEPARIVIVRSGVAAPDAAAPAVTPLPSVPEPPAEVAVAEVAEVATICRAASGLTPAQHTTWVSAFRAQLGDEARWTSTETMVSGRWIVYIGRLTDAQVLARRAQLRADNIDHRLVTTPRLAPGLALGTYSSPERARNALATSRTQGVRDARVEQERAPVSTFDVQLPALLPDELEALTATEALEGPALQPCP